MTIDGLNEYCSQKRSGSMSRAMLEEAGFVLLDAWPKIYAVLKAAEDWQRQLSIPGSHSEFAKSIENLHKAVLELEKWPFK